MGGGGGGYGFYGGLLSSQIHAALGRDEKTRYARFSARVRVWLDGTARSPASSSSTPMQAASTSAVLQRVLSGVSVGQNPPHDMPQPIILNIGES